MKKGFLTYGTICSGIEAPSLAWESLGWEPLWFSEIEPFPSAVLSHHYPDVPNLGDFTAPESWQHMIDNPPDILFGGTPCQAFSVAGQRQSLEDERGNLTLQFARLWHELRAVGTRYAVWENVPGVLNTPDNAFGCFLAGMVGERDTLPTPREGWSNSGVVSGPEGVIAWTVKDAQHFGVPQRRRRIFAVVGHPGDFSPSEILFKPESVSGHPEKGKEEREEVARAVGTGFTESSFGGWKKGCGTLRSGKNGVETLVSTYNESQTVFDPRSQDGVPRISVDAREVQAPSLKTATGGQRQTCVAQYWNGTDTANTLTSRRIPGSQRMPDKDNFQAVVEPIPIHDKATRYKGGGDTRNGDGSGNGLGVGKEGESSPTLTSGDRHAVGFHARQDPIHARGKSLPLEAKGGQAVVCYPIDTRNALRDPNKRDTVNRQGLGVGDDGDPSPTLTEVFTPAVGEMVVRRLTPVECERLMGMPDNWTQIPWRGKPKEECPDGNRYKAIGNSIAVPCLGWIGERIGDL